MQDEQDKAAEAVPDAPPSSEDPSHTDSGAPTNQAHRDVGDGTLIGAVPAGLSPKEMEELTNLDQPSESGTG